jgi:hypothetical protein
MNCRTKRYAGLSALAFAVLIGGAMPPSPAAAADAGAVVKACEHTPGCGYSSNKAGDISGCSPKTCFYCPADGKHSCFQVRKSGRPGGPGATIGGIKLAPAPANVRPPAGISGFKANLARGGRSTGPTNPNGPGSGPIGPGGTGPYAPPTRLPGRLP